MCVRTQKGVIPLALIKGPLVVWNDFF